MRYCIELFHKELCAYKHFIGNELIGEGFCKQNITLDFESTSTMNSIWFEPWGIVPQIRINNFLIDPGLAGINLFDHKFDIFLSDSFFKNYRKKDLYYRQESINVQDAYIYDSVIGVGNMHPELVNSIKQIMKIE